MRIGTGYDVHRLAEDRKLILGGVEIPYEKGLLGHSDADVLLHAIMDALLGAAALGDIGKHFPDTDEVYRGASSLKLLERVGELVEEELYVIGNIDATVIAQRPKLAPYIEQMRDNVAETLGIRKDQVNIKATTEEGLGFTGSGEGIAAQAVCLLSPVIITGRMPARWKITAMSPGFPRKVDNLETGAPPAAAARGQKNDRQKTGEGRCRSERSAMQKKERPESCMRRFSLKTAFRLWITIIQKRQRTTPSM